jgi:thiamine phosphate synthase YjbQ (UPF0047 family)
MKSHTEYLWFDTKTRRQLLNITDKLSTLVEKSKIQEGFCLVSAMHITAGIWVNDEESGLADAHLKRTVLHHQAILPVTDGKLDLGPWEQVFYAEFDGQRKKRVVVKIIGS